MNEFCRDEVRAPSWQFCVRQTCWRPRSSHFLPFLANRPWIVFWVLSKNPGVELSSMQRSWPWLAQYCGGNSALSRRDFTCGPSLDHKGDMVEQTDGRTLRTVMSHRMMLVFFNDRYIYDGGSIRLSWSWKTPTIYWLCSCGQFVMQCSSYISLCLCWCQPTYCIWGHIKV